MLASLEGVAGTPHMAGIPPIRWELEKGWRDYWLSPVHVCKMKSADILFTRGARFLWENVATLHFEMAGSNGLGDTGWYQEKGNDCPMEEGLCMGVVGRKGREAGRRDEEAE